MPTLPAIRNAFSDLPDEVQNHLKEFGALIESQSIEAALAYLFMMIEQGRYRAIKVGLVRKLKCNSSIIDALLLHQQFKRKEFRAIMKQLLAIDISKGDMVKLEAAEEVRDKALHGRMPSKADIRQALSDGLVFIKAFGDAVKIESGKNPFGDLRGLTSRITTLSKDQSKWIVMGVLSAASVQVEAENG